MNGTRSKILFSLIFPVALLTGCGGGGGGDSKSEQPTTDNPTTTPDPVLMTGVFLDSAVAGLNYTTSSGESGVTNSAGEYQYKENDNVTFSLASIEFPTIPAAAVVTPLDILDSRNLYSPIVLNTIRLLQSLDEDKDPSNSITLDSDLVQQLESAGISNVDLALPAEEFAQLLIQKGLFSSIADTDFVTQEFAISHFSSTLSTSKVIDSDGDGISNAADTDDDNDGVTDRDDLFPWDNSESADFDLDGIGDNADADDDNDGIDDINDATLSMSHALDSSIKHITHMVYHKVTNRVFITDQINKSLYIVSPDTGKVIQTLQYEKMPRRMAIANNTLYVSLLDRDFEYYSEVDGSGEIVVYNLSQNKVQQQKRFSVAVDPFDIVATNTGKVIVSSGSSQWTSILSYSAETGYQTGNEWIRHQSYLSLDPSQNYVFAADTDISPADFEKFDISGEGIISRGDSPYHGDYSIGGRIWVSEDFVFSRWGNIFKVSDMTHVSQVLGMFTIDDIQFDEKNKVAFASSNGNIYLINLQSLEVFRAITQPGDVQQVFLAEQFTYSVTENDNTLYVIKTPYQCADCIGNTAPVAQFTYTPDTGLTTDMYELDASSSYDTQSSELQYRWDFDDDGQWDTDFTTSSDTSKKFITAGTHFVTLQVMDTVGAVDSVTVEINVSQGEDSGSDVTDGSAYELQFNVTAKITDVPRQKLYVTDKSAKRLYVVDIADGETKKYFEFEFMPERMTLSPDGKLLYVALLTQEHSSYWWSEEQNGYIAVFDLEKQSQVNLFEIQTDPYDLVINDQNKLIVSSGSGQWTNIYAFDAENGDFLGSSSIYQGARLTLHPSGNYVFAADTNLTPSDFEKFDISGAGITSVGDSPYHGDFTIGGRVWITPDGNYLISRGGHVFRTDNMTYVQTLEGFEEGDELITALNFDSQQNLAFIVTDKGEVPYFNLSTWFKAGSIEVENAFDVIVNDNQVIVLSAESAVTTMVVVEHPCSICGTNMAPVADFTYTPENGTTSDNYEFNAAVSTDAEDGANLQYRWDLDGDNLWDTDFSSDPLISKKYILSGSKNITLQVKDSAGASNIKMITIEVAQGTDYGTQVTDSTAFELQFRVTDTAVDSVRQKLYVTDKQAKRLYLVDLLTGETEKYFEFDFMPENMTVSQDSSRLYVSLLKQEHSMYWYTEDQSGYIAVFDLAEQAKINVYSVPTDPFDLVINQQNKLIVSSGSGQHTRIYALNGLNGNVFSYTDIYQKGVLDLHPTGNTVFAADTGSYPSDFEKFDISSDDIEALGDSPYHGDYEINGRVWVTPNGEFVISRGGDVFYSSDMTHGMAIAGLDSDIIEVVFDETQNLALVLTDSKVIRLNLSNFVEQDSISSQSSGHLLDANNQFYGLKRDGIITRLIKHSFD